MRFRNQLPLFFRRNPTHRHLHRNFTGVTTVPTPSTPKLYLNTQEVADMLRISIRTLERMRVEGTGPQYLKAGKGTRSRVLYRPADIEAWLDTNSFQSTSQYVA
jgi:hypothetical protein